eukprot:SAG11_NODE_866_length_6832_cov_4.929303_6_plen_83_part_00
MEELMLGEIKLPLCELPRLEQLAQREKLVGRCQGHAAECKEDEDQTAGGWRDHCVRQPRQRHSAAPQQTVPVRRIIVHILPG